MDENATMVETKEQSFTPEEIDEINQIEKESGKRFLKLKETISFCLVALGQKNLDEYNKSYSDFFVRQYLNVPDKTFGTIKLATSIYDAVDDTISGLIIDRTRTRWGRVKPYLILPLPLIIISMWMLFTIPKSASATGTNIWVTVGTVLRGLGFSYFGAWSLILYNNTPNLKERNSLISISEFFKLFGTFLVSFLTFGHDFFQSKGYSTYSLYHWFSILSCVLLVLSCIYGFKNMRERIPLQSREEMNKVSPLESFKQVIKNPPLIFYILANFFNSFKGVASANEKFFWLNCTGKLKYSTISGLFTGLPNYIITPMTGKWVNRFGAKKVISFAGIFGGVAYMVMYLIGYHPFSSDFEAKAVPNLVWLILALTICGLPNCVIRVCMPSLLGDVFDYSEWKTGMRNEALINTVSGYFMKLGQSVDGWLSSMVRFWIGYEAINDVNGNPIRNTDSKVLAGMWFIFAVIPAIARFLTGVSFLFFKIDGKFKEQMLAELAERRAESIVELEEAESAAEDENK